MPLDSIIQLPRALTSYPDAGGSLMQTLAVRASIEPFNVIATAIFFLAILHIFIAPKLASAAHRAKQDAQRTGQGSRSMATVLHLLGEVELIFGLWAFVLILAMTTYAGANVAGNGQCLRDRDLPP